MQQLLQRPAAARPLQVAKALNVITRPLFAHYAVGIPSRTGYRDTDAVLQKGNRLLFVAPWRGRSMIGTAQVACTDTPGDVRITAQDVQTFLEAFNRSYPPARLQRDDVTFVHGGHLPIAGMDPRTGDVQMAKHARIDDHRQDGVQGLLSVTGVKYTTARQVAQRVVDRVFAMRGQTPPRSRSATTPL